MNEQLAIQEVLMSGNASVLVSVTGKDLQEYGEYVARKVIEQFVPKEEKYLKICC